MFKRTNANLLLRLLRLAASKDSPEAEAASVLQKFLQKQSTEGNSLLRSPAKASGNSQYHGCWQSWDVKCYSKVCSLGRNLFMLPSIILPFLCCQSFQMHGGTSFERACLHS